MSFSTETHTEAQIRGMTDQQMTDRYDAILTHFDEYATPSAEDIRYGAFASSWDWRTMRGVFPELCREIDNLRAEANRRVKNGTWTLSKKSG